MNRKRGKEFSENMTEDREWHLDRKVPIALIATIFIAFSSQTIAGVWWASAISERVTVLERSAVLYAPQGDRLTRMEVKIEGVEKVMLRLERLIELRTPNN